MNNIRKQRMTFQLNNAPCHWDWPFNVDARSCTYLAKYAKRNVMTLNGMAKVIWIYHDVNIYLCNTKHFFFGQNISPVFESLRVQCSGLDIFYKVRRCSREGPHGDRKTYFINQITSVVWIEDCVVYVTADVLKYSWNYSNYSICLLSISSRRCITLHSDRAMPLWEQSSCITLKTFYKKSFVSK